MMITVKYIVVFISFHFIVVFTSLGTNHNSEIAGILMKFTIY